MSKPFCIVFAAFLVAAAAIAPTGLTAGAEPPQKVKKWFTYDQVFGGTPRGPDVPPQAEVLAQLPSVTGWADDDHYLESRVDPSDKQRRVYAVSVADGSATLYRDPGETQKYLPKGLAAATPAASTPDNRRMVYSWNNDLYYFDAAAKKLRQLTANADPERTPRFSPDGRWIAYTRANNLLAYDLEDGIEHQNTTDGSEVILNGYASWVYMEEILGRASAYAAFWWSPDSTRLAYMRFDDSPVPTFPIYHAGRPFQNDPAWQHGTLEIQHYPKAGDPNPYVQMGVVNVHEGKTVWMDFEPKADHYIAWPFWTPDSKTLTVQWMNRGQDTIRFFNCDPATGRKTQIFEQQQSSWVVFFEDLTYLKDGSGMLIRSDVDGWDHLYLHGTDGTLRRQLTSGEWRVDSIVRVDEAKGYVYFMARYGKPWDTTFMRVKLDGTGLEPLTREPGSHSVRLSPGATYFIDTVSSIDKAPAVSLRKIDGTLVKVLGTAWTKASEDYAWGKAELFTIKSDDGQFDLPAFWVLPPDYDPKDAKKQYPVIVSIYGGPDAGTVSNSWLGMSPHYWAQRGVIFMSVDHRAGGAFGKKGVALMHRNLGKWEMIDLATAARWLRTKPFVAKNKIGIAGGSYGGYTTMMALFKGKGKDGKECPDTPCFNFGQAGSSVTAWELYDTVYTERYMDTPKENPEGYKSGAVLTYKDQYEGGLRITHGTIDDNVHMQNSLQVIDWLEVAGKPFESMVYPESRHGISQRTHYVRESHDFWVRTLLDGKMPRGPADGKTK
jgi:dipeptidyl-peptidase-4